MPPGIHYFYEGPYPVTFERGDIIFVAGNPPSGRELPWEHAAIVAETLVARDENDLWKLETYGMPESAYLDENRDPIAGLKKRKVSHLLASAPEIVRAGWTNLPPPAKCWTLAGKPFGLARVDERPSAGYYMDQFEAQRWEYILDYQSTGAFPPTFSSNRIRTNCVGFVCWVVDREIETGEIPLPRRPVPVSLYQLPWRAKNSLARPPCTRPDR